MKILEKLFNKIMKIWEIKKKSGKFIKKTQENRILAYLKK